MAVSVRSLTIAGQVDQILRVIPRERVTMLFSATMTSKVRAVVAVSLVWILIAGVGVLFTSN